MEDDKANLPKLIKYRFPGKLWCLANNPQIISICWDSTGEGLVINKEVFQAEMLSLDKRQAEGYFKLKDIRSFFRQLNLYGFKKVCKKHDVSAKQPESIIHFYNPNFKHAHPELLFNIKRLTRTNKAKLAAGLEVSSQLKRYQYLMLGLPQKHTAAAKAELPPALPPQTFHGFQQVRDCDPTPSTSQSFVNDVGNPGYGSCHSLMNAPSAQPFVPVPMSSHCTHRPNSSYIPPQSNYRPTTSVCERCSSGSSNSACHPDHPVRCLNYNDLTSNWQAGYAPNPRSGGYPNAAMQSGHDSGAQDCSFGCLCLKDLTPNWQPGDAPDWIMSTEMATRHDSGVQDCLVSDILISDLTRTGQAGDASYPQSDMNPNAETQNSVDTNVKAASYYYVPSSDNVEPTEKECSENPSSVSCISFVVDKRFIDL